MRALAHEVRDDEDGRVRAIRRSLARAVERVCPAWLAGQRDDIVQTATLRVLAAVRERDEEVGDAYLWRVAYTTTVDEIRRARARSRNEVELVDPEPPAAAGGGERPDDHAHGRRLADGISDCVGRLAEPRRLAVTLYLQGHGIGETAALLGWEAKRVENLIYRGLADLRGCLTGKGITP